MVHIYAGPFTMRTDACCMVSTVSVRFRNPERCHQLDAGLDDHSMRSPAHASAAFDAGLDTVDSDGLTDAGAW